MYIYDLSIVVIADDFKWPINIIFTYQTKYYDRKQRRTGISTAIFQLLSFSR